jgi:serine/threonine protein phosphatase PrpC
MPFESATACASFRAHSEDRFAVHTVHGGLVIFVADGAGGIPGGGAAADLVHQFVEHAIADPHFKPFDPESWVAMLVEADSEAEQDRIAGETTCVVVALADTGGFVGASVGDSGALVIRSDGTTDELTDEQQRKRRIGSGRASPVTFKRAGLEGVLVVASDGLFAYARPDRIAEVVLATPALDELPKLLVNSVRLPTSGDLQDDVAIVLARRA